MARKELLFSHCVDTHPLCVIYEGNQGEVGFCIKENNDIHNDNNSNNNDSNNNIVFISLTKNKTGGFNERIIDLPFLLQPFVSIQLYHEIWYWDTHPIYVKEYFCVWWWQYKDTLRKLQSKVSLVEYRFLYLGVASCNQTLECVICYCPIQPSLKERWIECRFCHSCFICEKCIDKMITFKKKTTPLKCPLCREEM